MRAILSSFLLLGTACAPLPTKVTPTAITLVPYLTMTPSLTPSQPQGLMVVQPASLPSPTPFPYTVKSGDTLGQIADQYHVSLDRLLAANPGVEPNALSIGKVLRIPGGAAAIAGDATATPVALAVQQIACHRIVDGGAWCFVLVRNDAQDLIENVSAQVSLIDPGGDVVATRTALLPLDILPPKQSLPLSVFFPPPVLDDVKPQVQILTAMLLLPDDPRYLPAQIQNTSVQVAVSGLSAQVSGQAALTAGAPTANVLKVAAVVYDAAGDVVGLRRWESSSPLQPGTSVPVSFVVASVAGRISRVEFAVEARP